ncbi:MAG: hypothetical protein PVH55_04315 [Desulfobacterales bacterium]
MIPTVDQYEHMKKYEEIHHMRHGKSSVEPNENYDTGKSRPNFQ